ncbi:Uncharacterized protein ABJ98_3636 [Pseudomonas syringae pv. aceris]|nr:Uncharacterized protein ABJ98_3636 [Pseudomonas syringae pv. aceris]
MTIDNRLQSLDEGVQARAVIKGEMRLQHIGIALLGGYVVIENAFLQRRQRVDILHIRYAARHCGDHLIDLRLGQAGQWQQIGRNALAILGDQIGRHHDVRATANCSSQCGQGWLAEQHAHIGAQAQLAHTPDQAHRQQRVTAQFEEVVVTTDPGHAQQVLPDGRDLRFGFTLWSFVVAVDQCIAVRRRQGLAVELAIRCQRHGLQQHVNGRNHVLRQLFLQMAAQVVYVHRGVPGHQGVISHQTLVAGNVFAGSDHGFVDRRVFGQTRIDLAELDTEAADFHLIIVTAEVFDIAVWQVAAQVAGAVHTCCWLLAERIREEAFGSEFVTVQVATGHTGTANVDFTRNTQWHGLLLLIQQVEPGVADRFADVRSKTVFAIHRHPA